MPNPSKQLHLQTLSLIPQGEVYSENHSLSSHSYNTYQQKVKLGKITILLL
jgi:hypothetical protein